MKKLIAVTASLITAASLSQVSAECQADKISVSDILDLVKNHSSVSVVLPSVGNLENMGNLENLANCENLQKLLSHLWERLHPSLPNTPDEDFDSDFNQPNEPDETPENPDETPEIPGNDFDSDFNQPSEPDETPDQTPSVPSEKPDNTPDTPSDAPSDTPDNDNTSVSSYADAVLKLVNTYRKQNGLSAVTLDTSLCGAADVRAKEIVRSFSHTRPNGSSCFTVLSENGISYNGAGENIAYGQSSPSEVMTAWMNSAGHRANILNASFTKLGVGVYQTGGTLYWTQLFTY